MTDSTKDAGLIAVLMERLEKQRLPRALALKEKVDQGNVLDDFDLEFLKHVLTDTHDIKPLLEKHPEYHSLVTRMLDLYHEIVQTGLVNEENS